MSAVTITGMSIIRSPKLTPNGHSILAYFSAEIGVFALVGCQLVRTNRGGISAWLPRLDSPSQHNQRQITLHDEATRNAMLRSARDMYQLMGGEHAEWRPREPDEEPCASLPLPPAITAKEGAVA